MKNTKDLLNVDFIFTNTVAKREVSALSLARQNVVKELNENVRSFSSYFKELRKSNAALKNWLEIANNKGRNFDTAKIHDIINVGTAKIILESDAILQASRKKPLVSWSASRIFQAFVNSVEIKATKKETVIS